LPCDEFGSGISIIFAVARENNLHIPNVRLFGCPIGRTRLADVTIRVRIDTMISSVHDALDVAVAHKSSLSRQIAARFPELRSPHDALIARLRHAMSSLCDALTAWLPTR
jgi:hypothetical protein